MANYMHARIAFDEALGSTIEKYNITFEEAMGLNTRPANPNPVPRAPITIQEKKR